MIKKLTLNDINDVLCLFNTDTLNKYNNQILSEQFSNTIYSNYGYYLNNHLVGCIFYWRILDSVDLDYIYVHKDYRKNKIASNLLDFMFNRCIDCDIYLEVSEYNIIAFNLYSKYNFSIIDKRKDYYGKNKHAIIMKRG